MTLVKSLVVGLDSTCSSQAARRWGLRGPATRQPGLPLHGQLGTGACSAGNTGGLVPASIHATMYGLVLAALHTAIRQGSARQAGPTRNHLGGDRVLKAVGCQVGNDGADAGSLEALIADRPWVALDAAGLGGVGAGAASHGPCQRHAAERLVQRQLAAARGATALAAGHPSGRRKAGPRVQLRGAQPRQRLAPVHGARCRPGLREGAQQTTTALAEGRCHEERACGLKSGQQLQWPRGCKRRQMAEESARAPPWQKGEQGSEGSQSRAACCISTSDRCSCHKTVVLVGPRSGRTSLCSWARPQPALLAEVRSCQPFAPLYGDQHEGQLQPPAACLGPALPHNGRAQPRPGTGPLQLVHCMHARPWAQFLYTTYK